jgi:hypothetical protein
VTGSTAAMAKSSDLVWELLSVCDATCPCRLQDCRSVYRHFMAVVATTNRKLRAYLLGLFRDLEKRC